MTFWDSLKKFFFVWSQDVKRFLKKKLVYDLVLTFVLNFIEQIKRSITKSFLYSFIKITSLHKKNRTD